MAQYALPSSDGGHATWVEGAGDTNATHWEELDEGFGAGRGSGSGPDDATTHWVGDGTDQAFTQAFSIRSILSAVSDPNVHTGHIVRSRNRKSAASGQQIDLRVSVNRAGAVALQAADYTNVDAVWTTRSFTVTEANAATITASDYAAMEITTVSDEVGGGQARVPHESAHEFECPDVSTGGAGFYYTTYPLTTLGVQ